MLLTKTMFNFVIDWKRTSKARPMHIYRDILKSIIDNNDDMVFALDLNKRYLFFNKAHQDSMKKRYGIEIAEGADVFDFLCTGFNVNDEIFERVAGGESFSYETEHDSGSLFESDTALDIFPLRGDNDTIFGVAVFAKNVSKERQLQMQNFQYAKMMEHIVSELSHKLRKPVATILGLIQLVDSDRGTNDMKRIIGYLKESTDELDSYIKQMTRLLEKSPA